MSKANRIVSYPSPLTVKKVMAESAQKGVSASKIVNEALIKYFNTPKK